MSTSTSGKGYLEPKHRELGIMAGLGAKGLRLKVIDFILAVRVGFEPTEPVKVQRFSRPPDSTALAPHRGTCLESL